MLPEDIIDRIDKDFQGAENFVVRIIMLGLFSKKSKYFIPDSICRSILYLSNGSLSEITNALLPLLQSDPRDLLNAAEYKAGNPGHYFAMPFPEIDAFFDDLYRGEEEPPDEFWQDEGHPA
jgi:hypothetical protein